MMAILHQLQSWLNSQVSTLEWILDDTLLDLILLLTPILVLLFYHYYFRATNPPPTNNNPPPRPLSNRAVADTDQDSPPRQIGKKKARNLERKTHKRNYIEGLHTLQAQKEQKRIALQRQQQLKSQQTWLFKKRTLPPQEKSGGSPDPGTNGNSAPRNPVSDVEDHIVSCIQTNLVVDLTQLAADVDVDVDQLKAYVSETIKVGQMDGYLDQEGRFYFLDPVRVKHLSDKLTLIGILDKADILSLLFDPDTT